VEGVVEEGKEGARRGEGGGGGKGEGKGKIGSGSNGWEVRTRRR